MLVVTGVGHLTFARRSLRPLVPDAVPMDKDRVVVLSGLAELGLAAALVHAPRRRLPLVGRVAAGFLLAVFPANVHQYRRRIDTLGLNTNRKRLARLLLQPPLIAWALLSTRR